MNMSAYKLVAHNALAKSFHFESEQGGSDLRLLANGTRLGRFVGHRNEGYSYCKAGNLISKQHCRVYTTDNQAWVGMLTDS
jgi:hypothetical protein